MVSSNAVFVDFDGTIVEHKYPEIGQPLPGVFETLKDLKSAGYRLVLWTCREGKTLDEAVEFCRQNGVEFDGVNQTLPDEEFREGLARKPYCGLFIDDKNLGGFPGWNAVRKILLPEPLPEELVILKGKWEGKKIYGVVLSQKLAVIDVATVKTVFQDGIRILDESDSSVYILRFDWKSIEDADEYLTTHSQNGDGASLV